MSVIPIVHLTDTILQVVDFDRLLTEKPAYEALLGWLRSHGIDPNTVPSDGIIEVFPETRVIHHGYRPKETRATETMQVVRAHPIDPWPPELVALAKTYGGRDAELEDLRVQVETLRPQAVAYNDVMWKLAVALGHAKAGDGVIDVDLDKLVVDAVAVIVGGRGR